MKITPRFLPFWFVKAIERDLFGCVTSQDAQILFPFDFQVQTKIYIQILLKLQDSLLESINSFSPYITSSTGSEIGQFINFSLLNLRVLSQESKDDFCPLFLERNFERADSENKIICFKKNNLSTEFLLGYCSAYNEVMRKYKGNSSPVAKAMFDRETLMIPEGIIDSLTINEIVVLLRLQRSLQNKPQDNLGCTLYKVEELLSGIDLPEDPKLDRGSSWFNQARLFLKNLFKKLDQFQSENTEFVDERGLKKFMLEEYFEDMPSFSLWFKNNLMNEDVFNAEDQHKMLVARIFYEEFMAVHLEDYIHFVSGPFFKSADGAIRQIIERITSQLSDADKSIYVMTNDHCILNVPIVFVEWCIRSIEGHAKPLSSEVLNSSLGKIMKSKTFESIESRLEAFLAEVKEDIQKAQEIFESTDTCFANTRCRDAEILQEEVTVVTSQETVLLAELDREDEKKLGSRIIEPTLTVEMKKIAIDELEKIKRHDPEQYQTIKKAYFSAMDPTRRKVVFEVQERLGVEKFEEQLKNSLARFMAENPSLWNSVSLPSHLKYVNKTSKKLNQQELI